MKAISLLGVPLYFHMAVVRSIYAKIERINLDAARAVPGVVDAFEGAELVSSMPTFDTIPVPNLKVPDCRPFRSEKIWAVMHNNRKEE